MNVNDLYPSKYATGQDLNGRDVAVTISHLRKEKMYPPGAPPQEKWVVFFKQTERGIVMSRVLAKQIADATGFEETDNWTDKRITLYPETIMVAGQKRTVVRAKKLGKENI